MIPENFHFIRIEWLWAIFPIALLLFFIVKNIKYKNHWNNVCDAPLLHYQLIQQQQSKQSVHSWQWLGTFSFLLLIFSLLIISLAGPSWEKKQQPIFQQEAALVVILDLSLSMNASDIKPSRLERAKLKLIDILKRKKEGQTALIAFAGDAHIVTPLTIDNKTIISLLPALNASIMPLPGSHLKDALLTAKELLINSGFMQGDILLMTDGINSSHQQAITQYVNKLRQQGYLLSIIGVGSESGSPIPNSGGFIKDKRGQVVLSKLNSTKLKILAQKGGGQYHKLSLNDDDFQDLLEKNLINNNNPLEQDNQIQQWVDAGAYVILIILPLVLFFFRRGLLSISFLALLIPIIVQNPAQAEEQTIADTVAPSTIKQKAYNFINSDQWNNLWMTEDQRGQKDFKQKQYSQAAERFNNSHWKAGAHYRAGEFEKAIQQYELYDDAESLYNKGNALANLQKFEQAIENYDAALKKQENLTDAITSRDYVKKLLEQKKQQQEQEQQSNQDSSENQSQSENKQQDSDSKQSEQKESEQENQQNNTKSDTESSEPDENKDAENNTSENMASQQSEQDKNSAQDQQQQQQSPQESQKESDQPEQQEPSPSELPAQETDTEEGKNASEDVLSQLSQEEQQSLKQWLQRIPDNPGELLRIKFRNNSMNKQRQQDAPEQYKGEPW